MIPLAAVCLLGAYAVAHPAAAPRALTVSAAISLSDALEEIAQAYRRAGGGEVRFNLAASNTLARQIVNGAPVDVFISADAAQMDVVERAGAIVPGSRVTVAANQLAIVAAPGKAAALRIGLPARAQGIGRLAIGDPAAVPAGVYARAYLERKGLWDAYRDRIVPTANVRAAMAAVENGTADAAIVYVTDARRSTRAVVAHAIPLAEAPFIGYQAAVVARTPNSREARRFLDFLGSEVAQQIFVRHGFLRVEVNGVGGEEGAEVTESDQHGDTEARSSRRNQVSTRHAIAWGAALRASGRP